jgi:hypothetical protein
MRLLGSWVVSLLIATSKVCNAFEFPKLPEIFKPSPSSPIQFPSNVSLKKSALLQTISGTANGKNASPELQAKVLEMVADLERSYPVSETLLSNPKEAMILDGTWYLQYTSPSDLDSNDEFPVRIKN